MLGNQLTILNTGEYRENQAFIFVLRVSKQLVKETFLFRKTNKSQLNEKVMIELECDHFCKP